MITVINASFFGNERHIERVVNQPQYEGVEYILYTNQPERAEGTNWKVIDTQLKDIGPRLAARKIKTHIHTYHPNSDYWLWIDSNMEIKTNPHFLVEKYLSKFDVCAMPHPERNNWWEEGNVIVGNDMKMDSKENVQRGINKYFKEGLPPTQLWETGCLLRRNNSKVIKFNNVWWNEIQENSIRDQMSIHYASWKTGVYINNFPGTNSTNALRFQNKPYLPQWNEIIRVW